ncbi:MAG: hypothetical protein R3B46_07805 [Phycisphaerales bacterium]
MTGTARLGGRGAGGSTDRGAARGALHETVLRVIQAHDGDAA